MGAWGLRAISALLVVNNVTTLPPPRALTLPRKPHARDLLYFHHGLLDGCSRGNGYEDYGDQTVHAYRAGFPYFLDGLFFALGQYG